MLSYLDIKDLLQCAQVCKRINKISTDETLYQTVNLSGCETELRKVPVNFIEFVLKKGCKTLNLKYSGLLGEFSDDMVNIQRL